MSPTTKSLEVAREIVRSRGGVCLVPLPGKGGISSHEKTFCDCEVEEMIAKALDQLKPWPDEVEILDRALSYRGNPTAQRAVMETYDYLTAHAMPEMCVDGVPSVVTANAASFDYTSENGGDSQTRFAFVEGAGWVLSRLKLRSVSEVREETGATLRASIEAFRAERTILNKLAESATEVWNMQCVTYRLREVLTEYEASRERTT